MSATATARQQRWLRDVPTHLLEAELVARRALERAPPPVVVLPDLEVDAGAGLVLWRGVEHTLSGRRLELLHALALEAARGRRRSSPALLARRVWPRLHERAGVENLRVYVSYLNRELPGLLRCPGHARPKSGYGLNVGPEEAAP